MNYITNDTLWPQYTSISTTYLSQQCFYSIAHYHSVRDREGERDREREIGREI